MFFFHLLSALHCKILQAALAVLCLQTSGISILWDLSQCQPRNAKLVGARMKLHPPVRALSFKPAEMHVGMASIHRFDQWLRECIINDSWHEIEVTSGEATFGCFLVETSTNCGFPWPELDCLAVSKGIQQNPHKESWVSLCWASNPKERMSATPIVFNSGCICNR